MNIMGLKALHDQIAERAIADFNKTGKIAPTLVLFQLEEDFRVHSVMPLPDALTASFFSGPAGKNVLSQVLRDIFTDGGAVRERMIADGFRPDLAVQVNEAWVRRTNSLDEAQQRMSSKESLAHDPQRSEAVVILMHTAEATLPVMHPISETPKRHCSMGEFPTESLAKMFSGRFAMQDIKRPPAEKMN